ncbi:MAG: hypothetical protein WDZ93_01495 [Candidatus Paceibacterota bacterium]
MKQYQRISIILACVAIGVIGATVLERGATAEATEARAAAIKELPAEDPEVAAFWAAAVAEKGGRKAYMWFGEVYSHLSEVQQHSYAHVFGEALYKTEGIPGVAVCDSGYGFGCYHSFFGRALIENGLSILSELDQACIDAYGPKGLGCQHGIGHGVIAELGYDELNKSLEACMRLNWQGPIGGCTSGVFMEYNFATMQQADMRQPGEWGMHHPCTEVDDRYIEACYFEQPAWWSALNGQDYAAVGDLCSEIEDQKGREACYRGAGNVIAGLQEYDVDEMLAACGTMPDREGEMLCIEGAVWIVSNQPAFKDEWERLCDSLDGEYHRRCLMSHDLI